MIKHFNLLINLGDLIEYDFHIFQIFYLQYV